MGEESLPPFIFINKKNEGQTKNHGGCREFPHSIGTIEMGCLILG
jgi:hypothetical protein